MKSLAEMFEEILPENPFTTEYAQKEIDFYGLKQYDKDGVTVISRQLFGRADEYLNKQFWTGELTVPILFIDGKLWMSLTPMEIQSMVVPINCAGGSCATAGLGMGYFPLKIAQEENVDEIDVYEIDQRVIDFFKENFSHRKGYEKINLIHGDAREEMIGKQYDYVWMDIYQTLLPDQVIKDAILFKTNNYLDEYRFWGEEKVILAAINNPRMRKRVNPNMVERAFLTHWLKDEIRRSLYQDICEPEFCRKVLKALERYE